MCGAGGGVVIDSLKYGAVKSSFIGQNPLGAIGSPCGYRPPHEDSIQPGRWYICISATFQMARAICVRVGRGTPECYVGHRTHSVWQDLDAGLPEKSIKIMFRPISTAVISLTFNVDACVATQLSQNLTASWSTQANYPILRYWRPRLPRSLPV